MMVKLCHFPSSLDDATFVCADSASGSAGDSAACSAGEPGVSYSTELN